MRNDFSSYHRLANYIANRYFTKFSTPPAAGYQIVLFSATFPDHVWQWADRFAPKANKIALKKQEVSVANIRQFYIDCKNEEHKYEIIVKLYEMLTVGQSIIFCQVCSLPFLELQDTNERLIVASIHGRQDSDENDYGRTQSCFTSWCQRRS